MTTESLQNAPNSSFKEEPHFKAKLAVGNADICCRQMNQLIVLLFAVTSGERLTAAFDPTEPCFARIASYAGTTVASTSSRTHNPSRGTQEPVNLFFFLRDSTKTRSLGKRPDAETGPMSIIERVPPPVAS
ncbi:unnamed protein product [Protopolystoma xenopodis]|uniref:Uncharacterized protein n=1 Tax=Protopolystoma xenopodis TaxID=117903 RepID=A0A3S5AG38_9PLAT|nr:unnamed protein product [Protopolystoma xenopodis]